MSLLAAPKYFKLKETPVDTVLVTEGIYKKTSQSEKYGNDQYYFLDRADKKLKCLSGGVLGAIIENNELNVDARNKPVEIIYKGTEIMESGKFAGKEAHQFEVNPVGWGLEDDIEDEEATEAPTESQDLNDLA
tara:strand:- start:36864 stop:37262 length:399 start_codon:yes stop_codon:yes gene_type:complete